MGRSVPRQERRRSGEETGAKKDPGRRSARDLNKTLLCELQADHVLTVLVHEVDVIAPAVLKECTNLVHGILLCPTPLAGLLFVSLIFLDMMDDTPSQGIRRANSSD